MNIKQSWLHIIFQCLLLYVNYYNSIEIYISIYKNVDDHIN